ncbi:MAG TPA: L,D-transpeptidase [Acidimicrobiia bacterium]
MKTRRGRLALAAAMLVSLLLLGACGPYPGGGTGSGDLIDVNLSTQTLTLWRGGHEVLSTHVSTGKPSTPTVQGRFTIYSMQSGWVHTQNGSVYKPLWFHGNYGVHGFGSVPSYPASHGCVRVPVGTQDQVFANAYVGMAVWIHP